MVQKTDNQSDPRNVKCPTGIPNVVDFFREKLLLNNKWIPNITFRN
jgi:hypothetical protein